MNIIMIEFLKLLEGEIYFLKKYKEYKMYYNIIYTGYHRRKWKYLKYVFLGPKVYIKIGPETIRFQNIMNLKKLLEFRV